MEEFSITTDEAVTLYSSYSDFDLYGEYSLLQLCFSFLVCYEIDSHIMSFLDFIEPLLVDEMILRFCKKSNLDFIKPIEVTK